MKNIASIVLIILQMTYFHVSAQNMLNYTWKFKTGDDIAWAEPAFNDSDWPTIVAGKTWETKGYDGYDGFAWYRQQVTISSSLKKEAQLNGGLILNLATIDDVDFTYWNGELIGETGKLPPYYETAYDKNRSYKVPFDAIIWDQPNTIAVRVFDSTGGGGIVGDDISLKLPGIKDKVNITPQFERPDHLYLSNLPINIGLSLENTTKESISAQIGVIVTSDFGQSISNTKSKLTIKSGKPTAHQISLGNLPAGFYQIELIVSSTNSNNKMTFSIGVRPEEIVSPTNRPDDFEAYWNKAKTELACIDPQFKLIRQDQLCTDTKEVFILEMRSLGNVLIRGWYSKPVKSGVYPAILHVQGYSTFAQHNWGYSGDDMVTLVLNIRGHGFSKDFINPGFPGYLQHMVEDKELYIYRGAYMDCIRAIDFLYIQPEIDNKRIAVEGGSQGGALSFATAALDNKRIALCVPSVPFLSDFEDYFKVAGWPGGEFAQYFDQHPGSKATVMKNLSYIDIKNLAPWIKAPMLMGVGLVDPTCPPHINFAGYNLVQSSKNYVVYPEAGHSLPSDHDKTKYAFIKKYFGMTE